MANVIINDSNLIAIGNAIREKNGTEDTYKPREMAAAIAAIETGGGGGSGECNLPHIPEEALTITGNCNCRFAYNGWTWFLREAGDKIITKDINNASQMFYSSSELTSIPFDINFKDGGAECNSMFANCFYLKAIPAIDFKQTSHKSLNGVFSSCKYVTQIGKLSNLYPSDMGSMFSNCEYLRYLPEFENLNLDRMYTYAYSGYSSMFSGCRSLRSIPEDFLKQLYNPTATNGYYTLFQSGFNNCLNLDELRGLNPQTGTITSNMFTNLFLNCYRLKDLVFATQEDGTPYSVNWKSQTIDLSAGQGVGWSNSKFPLTGYNSGITKDKKVTDDASYQALKNDPDWWTGNIAYSRYNHDSAVNTINSLPITTNTGCSIKFSGAAGELTDGGAINTLTEEEIAVAAAKGWTVTLS